MTDIQEEVSYHFDDNVSTSINSDDSQQTNGFRRVLPQMLAVAVKNLVLFGYGLTLGFPTIVIPALKANGTNSDGDFNLSNEEISWFSSINLLCVPLGCFFSGIFTEPTGKRRAMQIIKVPIFLSWLIFYFATSVYHLYIGLCLVGISGGLMEASVLTYVAEVTEPKYRGMLTASGTTCVVIGILVQFVLGTFLKWRKIALVCSVMPLLTIIALFFVPESPYWLLTKNRVKEARKSLAWLRGWVEVHKVSEEFDEIHQSLIQKRHHSEKTTSTKFHERFLPYTKRTFLVPFALVSSTLFVGCFSGKTPLQTYAVEIFQILDTPIDKYHATVFLGLCELIGAILCISLVRFVGKRPLIFLSLIVSAICFSSTALFAHHYGISSSSTSASGNLTISYNDTNPDASRIGCQPDIFTRANHTMIQFENFIIDCDQKNILQINKKNDITLDTNILAWTPLILLLTSALFIHIGIGILPWGLIGEMFPSNVRSGGSGLSSGTGYLFAFFSNKLFLWMLDTMTLPGTFWFYSSVSIVGCILFYFLLPETEGKSLLEIEAHFARKNRNNHIDIRSNQSA